MVPHVSLSQNVEFDSGNKSNNYLPTYKQILHYPRAQRVPFLGSPALSNVPELERLSEIPLVARGVHAQAGRRHVARLHHPLQRQPEVVLRGLGDLL